MQVSSTTNNDAKAQNVPGFNADEHNRETIQKILKLAQEGKSLGCFVCRQAHQSVPMEKDRVWVSLDSASIRTKIIGERLHLILDVNDRDKMQQIRGIFDKVVLDWSSLLCCQRPYRDLSLLLKPCPDSELIIEATPGCNTLDWETNASSIDVERGTYRVPLDKGGRTTFAIWKEDLLPQLDQHLKKLFEKVFFCEHMDWPFEYGHDDGEKCNFFILRGPTSLN